LFYQRCQRHILSIMWNDFVPSTEDSPAKWDVTDYHHCQEVQVEPLWTCCQDTS